METWPGLFLFLEVFSSTVLSYPNGKIGMACNSMLPMHGTSAPQTSQPLYAISVSSTTFNPGDEITVSLAAMNDSSFKGFLLQAQAIGGTVPVGVFQIITPKTQGLVCNNIQNSSVSHTDSRNKQNVSAIWVAPPDLKRVIFKATVLHNFTVFWAEVQSQILVSSSPPVLMSSKEVCGAQKFCFSIPGGCSPLDPECYFMKSEAIESGAFRFEMSGLSDGYVAIGFSDDTIMGNDDIYICGRNDSDHVDVQHAFSTGRTTPSIKPLENVEILETSFKNGIIRCSFISRNAISTQSRTSDSLYYVFLAYGPSSAGKILKHSRTPFITKQKVNISSSGTQGGSQSTPLIIKAHGALMLVAWMTTGSLGMVFARYLKSIKKPLLGKDVWFQIHFWMMLLTVAAAITAFILAFVARKGWSSGAEVHAIIGCIVMILSFFQPLIAFFRPSPQNNRLVYHTFNKNTLRQSYLEKMEKNQETPAGAEMYHGAAVKQENPQLLKSIEPSSDNACETGLCNMEAETLRHSVLHCINRRFIFNWFHMLNALVIKILADADLFLGLKMLSSPNHWMVKTMGGFVGWEALIAIALDVNLWLKKREIYDDSQAKVKSEILLLLIYLCGSLGFVIALLVGIGKS
ncbi:putative ferric-chelate reductase 1 [Heteronotia binoei]|uniref:putative ferric-chelate reductase 1 n=1 Tax=Heteronotia binoei TaxID=13085 RepID=UPI00292F94FA|nr:putative ferric-chelate reductase 1 [Heteronotia binoei]